MREYWNDMMTSRPGMHIKETETVHDNVYIKDAADRVWQIVIQYDGPEVRLIEQGAP